ncbi:MAG: polysaccharide pyruvyl transferase family protein [Parvibaculaceae bacterium]
MSGILPKRRHAEVMDELKLKLGSIAGVIPKSKPVVYLDYPMHGNVGDLLIHAGTDRFFADHGYEVIGHFSLHEFCLSHRPGKPLVFFKDSVRRLDDLVATGATIVFHGGGNLGDLYRDYQMFRELVIARYPDAPMVILPQSAHFEDPANRAAVARLFAAHPRLHIFARDRESLDFARNDCGCPAELMPDMAHALWGSLPRHHGGGAGLLNFRRRDKEAPPASAGGGDTFDWDDLVSGFDRGMIRCLRKMQSVEFPARRIVPNHVLWRWYRDNLIRRSIAFVAGYGQVVTDRLHGMILGSLLDMPVTFEDNSYGKLSRYYSEWLSASDRIDHRRRQHMQRAEAAAPETVSAMGELKHYGT